MQTWAPGRLAMVEWEVKRSLLHYMMRDDSFAVECSGGASFDPEHGARIPGGIGADGVLRLSGDVVLSAHGGALVVPLVSMELDPERGLTIADPVDGLPGRISLVSVMLQTDGAESSEPDGRTLRFATALAPEADYLFMFNYVPGAAFDELRVRFYD